MNWVLWIVFFVSLGAPVGILLADRILGIRARTLFATWGLVSLIAFVGALLVAIIRRDPLANLVFWGIVSGVLATAALDVVRLIGFHVFKAFPIDMPRLFGTIALDLGPHLQRNMMAQMVQYLADLPEAERKQMMSMRLNAIARLQEPVRVSVVGAMQRGLSELLEPQRQAVIATQMGILADMPSDTRKTLMQTMDSAMNSASNPPYYPQPRGLPRIPMEMARRFLAVAYPKTLHEGRVSGGDAALLGYVWHFLIGSTFGITYNIVFGQGTWALAFSWGIFIWATMMVAMPIMMPMIRFPWWFPIIPLIAHLVMAIPIGAIALHVIDPYAAANASLLGFLWVR
jgi:hypothetical protein